MSKPKYSISFKVEVAKAYLNGEGSYRSLAARYNVGAKSVDDWARRYRKYGEAGFIKKEGNSAYTSSFKKMCVEAVINGNESEDDIIVKYKISSRTSLRRWIKLYNANRELKDYIPEREVYMAEAKRKTTLEERKEIAKYCIAHDKDYKGTAAIYDVSYSQVYNWVMKYLKNGEEGLTDKRGYHKSDDEVDELERLRRENQRLKRKLEEQDRLVELLKKVKEIEGM